MRTVHVEVTQEDIDKADLCRESSRLSRNSFPSSALCFFCPVFQALKRTINFTGWIVHADSLHYGNYKAKFPQDVRQFIHTWDTGGEVQPIKFNLELPSV